ncbi:MAG: hypothetical protein LBW85_03350, partial [Deltaproteobacteria bacterium]|nr:hypothetical protein [Deltaproteobacteria bacterium]
MQGTNVSRALVLGAGKSGAAAVRLLRRLGVEPSVYDDNTPWEKKGKEAAGLGLEGARLFGPGQLPSIEAFGQVIV